MNLVPADLPKQGPAYDLPIAVGILLASGQVSSISSSIFIGELSLDGGVRHTDGILSMVSVAKEEDFQQVFVPFADVPEASLIGGLEIIPVESPFQLVSHLNGLEEIAAYGADVEALSAKRPEYPIDFTDIRGQEHVKRALEVAAGGQSIMKSVIRQVGGVAKSILASGVPPIRQILVITCRISLASQPQHPSQGFSNRPLSAVH